MRRRIPTAAAFILKPQHLGPGPEAWDLLVRPMLHTVQPQPKGGETPTHQEAARKRQKREHSE